MYNSFISIVSVIHSPYDLRRLPELLENMFPVLRDHFSDFEIILVNNGAGVDIDAVVAPFEPDLKHHLYLLNLSNRTNRNHAFVAGLDRSNGDYTIIFEMEFADRPEYILQLFDKTREHYDLVYLRAKVRKAGFFLHFLYHLFYYIMSHYSNLRVDNMAHNTRIISRRALNSLLRLRENLRYMKAIYSIVGYNTTHIETDEPLANEEEEKFSDRFKTSLIAITSFTTFLNTMMLWLFLFSLVFLVGVIVNALKLKFTGIDLFGNMQEAVSGWTFLVILISVFFAVTCLNLYIMSIYLANIYHEIKKRPLYIIESIKRF